MKFDNNYFSLFNKLCNENTVHDLFSLPENEAKRIVRTIRLIPETGVNNILDVGCCDGRISNLLQDRYKTTSLDIGAEGLKSVQGHRIIGTIADLPLKDRSFDLVICTEVLEHLPKDIFGKGISELKRVSKKFILVTVPYRENIRKGFVLCQYCGKTCHVYGHIRSFSKRSLSSMFIEWQISKIEIFGEREGNIGMSFLYYLKNKLGNKWDNADQFLCPYCCRVNNEKSKSNILGYLLERLIWRLEKIMPFKNLNRVSVLFQRTY